ncbi:hypothetical protein [Desulfovibrio sp. ZJ369]|uniref:hypothetical protein n=1 Tax=Desulfovibrio sp. ZJ369 TaxID=2709793 RepID=UPI001F1565C0|nr:hypothetical protein [Desulfovibrio sp. ZJ369]
MEQTYGYIRVSSVDQNETRQRIALEQQAIPPDRIFMEDVGQGLSAAAIPSHAQKAQARRAALHHQHRSTGQKL